LVENNRRNIEESWEKRVDNAKQLGLPASTLNTIFAKKGKAVVPEKYCLQKYSTSQFYVEVNSLLSRICELRECCNVGFTILYHALKFYY
jgi:hypothetical protein